MNPVNRLRGPNRALPLLALALGALLGAATAVPAMAQNTGAPRTRAEVKKETLDFLKTHQWDEAAGRWMPEDNPASGPTQTRAQVHEELHVFLRNHRWDDRRARWVPLNPQRRLSTLSRDRARAETEALLRTHHWDDNQGAWVPDQPPKAAKAAPKAKP